MQLTEIGLKGHTLFSKEAGDVVVHEENGHQVMHGKETLHFRIKVKPEEFSLLVGKGGSTIKALRVVMSKLAGKKKKMVFVDLDEGDK